MTPYYDPEPLPMPLQMPRPCLICKRIDCTCAESDAYREEVAEYDCTWEEER